jgi:4-alpha-glucanotransferase
MQPNDLPQYQQTVQQAMTLLGKKDLTLIVHGASFPSVPAEDTGMGSPNSNGAKALVNFLQAMGFNGIQLGPAGKTKSVDASPYMSTSFSDNPLFIDLAQLSQDPEWQGLLSPERFQSVVQGNPNAGRNRVAYGYVYAAQDAALREAFETFKTRKASLPALNEALEAFKTENASWLNNDALYEALSVEHGNDYWPLWPNALDKRLVAPQNDAERQAATARIQDLMARHADTIDFYQFTQFVADAQKQAMKTYADAHGIKMLADRQVAFSDRDLWAYQDLFLPGFKLGAPPDYFSADGQGWGFPIFHPNKLFEANGDLGPAGKLLLSLFEKMFRENRGGVRIDHIIGLIDPWVYPEGKLPKVEEGAGRLYSSPDHPKLSVFSRITRDNLTPGKKPDDEEWVQTLTPKQIEQYTEVMKIVLKAAENQGLGKDAIICEDLGTLTTPVKLVLEKLGLSGVRVTQFVDPAKPDHMYRGKNVAPNQWVMVGTHDNESLSGWADGLFSKNQVEPHARILAEDLLPQPDQAGQRDGLLNQLKSDPKAFVRAKFAELFASPAKHIQVFFTDFFGMKETYNRPGTAGDGNWSLRVPNQFEDYYYGKLQANEALNLPEVLLMAMKARGLDRDAANQPLVEKLTGYMQTLKA